MSPNAEKNSKAHPSELYSNEIVVNYGTPWWHPLEAPESAV